MLSVVINPYFDWGHDRPPRHEYHETVIYEAHVKGLTMTHPEVPEEIRGTYAGIAHPAIIDHLTTLGVTALELMPVHQFVDDTSLQDKGLTNYWGYNTIGFLAPHNGFSPRAQRGEQVTEFKAMVKALHEADIEVILDVVYNHTAEGNQLGPTLCFTRHRQRGVLPPRRRRQGALLRHDRHREQPAHAAPPRPPADHGLAALLGHRDARRRLPLRPRRHPGPPVPRGRQAVGVLRPHPAGPGDLARSSSSPSPGTSATAATRSATSPRCGPSGTASTATPCATSGAASRARSASSPRGSPARATSTSTAAASRSRRINFVTAHDGFTLRDLVSYNEKHNEANGEDGRDGESHNRSWNCGVEGPTDDPEVNGPAPAPAAQLPRHAPAVARACR